MNEIIIMELVYKNSEWIGVLFAVVVILSSIALYLMIFSNNNEIIVGFFAGLSFVGFIAIVYLTVSDKKITVRYETQCTQKDGQTLCVLKKGKVK